MLVHSMGISITMSQHTMRSTYCSGMLPQVQQSYHAYNVLAQLLSMKLRMHMTKPKHAARKACMHELHVAAM